MWGCARLPPAGTGQHCGRCQCTDSRQNSYSTTVWRQGKQMLGYAFPELILSNILLVGYFISRIVSLRNIFIAFNISRL